MNESTDPPEEGWGRAWSWVPSLYFVQGLPYTVVNVVSVPMYKTLGVANDVIAGWTSTLGLIWALKALWAPLVDGVSTKRRWTLAMQLAFVPALILVAFALPTPRFVELSLAGFALLALASATHDIAADGLYMLGLSKGQQSAFVGVRSTFWRLALVFGEGGLVVLAGVLGTRLDSARSGWMATLGITAALFAVAAAYNAWALPAPISDVPRDREHGPPTTEIVRSFFARDGILVGLLFILWFRFAENHLAKLVSPFLLDPREVGGLGWTLEQVGFAKGTVGVLCLVAGGILGGGAIYRHGLTRWMMPMAFALNAPNLVYLYLATAQPEAYGVGVALIGVEQFGYGFGFAAYMMTLIHIADGPYKTAHYAFATGLMALAVWASASWSGAMQLSLGYQAFFAWVVLLTLPGFAVAWAMPLPENFGKGGTD
ncbi:MAG: MFS transporter [Deltaproteobacteria bacterium]|nr:MAG: MFS transporter [Deltaproteobacteria bacterium]